MLELKKDQNSRIVMYGHESKEVMLTEINWEWRYKSHEELKCIFSGTKSGLLEKDESFWKDIIDPLLFAYDSYPTAKKQEFQL